MQSCIRNFVLLAVIAPGMLCGCQRVGPDGQLVNLYFREGQENEMGLQAYEKILSESQISDDAVMTEIIQRVGQRIAAAANKPDFDWEFNLLESEQVNAFCLPGGKIAVWMSQAVNIQVLMKGTQFVFKDASQSTQESVLAVLGAGAQYGAILPFSRQHELQADQYGLLLTARAGYDPRESVGLWERMAQASQGKPHEFFSTHPSEARRIVRLQNQMQEAMAEYEKAPQKHGIGDVWGNSRSLASTH
jgi:predicted Zn-dependent protease